MIKHIKHVLHTGRRLLHCPGKFSEERQGLTSDPNGVKGFPLPVPRWSNFSPASHPWALEFAHPCAQDSPIRRWCSRKCLSWHGPVSTLCTVSSSSCVKETACVGRWVSLPHDSFYNMFHMTLRVLSKINQGNEACKLDWNRVSYPSRKMPRS